MKMPRTSCWLMLFLSLTISIQAQTNVTIRVMAANITSGNYQSYETAGIDIFQGLKPDIVAIQEFRYNSSSASNDLRTLVNTAFGTNFTFFCQSGFNIPNGIVSRYPIVSSGSWTDSLVSDRSYAWAQIDLPGTNDLYVVSVHLYSGGTATDRNTEANEVKAQIQANFPANAWVIVGGDFNTSTRSEAAVTTFKTFLSDFPIPDDGNPTNSTPDQNTNEPRNHPYDYLLPSFSMTNRQVPVVIGSRTFTNGLVFDSAVYAPLGDVSPVASGDSHVNGMQHMAVIKDFLISGDSGGVSPVTNPPSISSQPQPQSVFAGQSATFSVTAAGTAPLNFQWRYNGTNISGAITNPLVIPNVQLTNVGNYSVVVANDSGSVTSSVAALSVTTAVASATNVVISQIYGGGGFSGASLRNDFVELFNPSGSSVNLGSWSVQYASYTSTTWSKVNLTGSISPYSYYLVQLGSDGTGGTLLPTADVTGTVNISATRGKIALVSNQTALSGSNPVGGATVVDFVGYGAANGYEGTAPATGGDNTTSALRKNGGLTDSNDNAADFITLTPPSPRNSASPANPPVLPPAVAAVLANVTLGGGQIQFGVSGTAGSNYIIQSASDLSVGNWTPVKTNPAPFTFTETNLASPQKFYRAVAQ